jgi:hypothetical protein
MTQQEIKKKYLDHKANSKRRGISFELSFDQWWDIWTSSGKWELMGRGAGKYCMSRVGDTGPYEVGNVYINSFEANLSEGNLGKKGCWLGKKHSTEHIEKCRQTRLGKPKPTTTCPHCDKTGGAHTMSRWHFDNCKLKE